MEHHRPPHGLERRTLEDERQALIVEKERIDAIQHDLARQLGLINRRLREIRDHLWPREDLRRGWILRRPPLGGPPPIPKPTDDAPTLSGVALRHAALAVLTRSRRALPLTEIHRTIVLAGYRIGGRDPVKALGDALAYEHQRGSAVRVSRGVYRVGVIGPGQRRRVAHGLVARGRHPILGTPTGADHPIAGEGGMEDLHEPRRRPQESIIEQVDRRRERRSP